VIDPTGGAAAAGQTSPTTIYDGGPRTVISSAFFSPVLNNAGTTLVAAAAGLRTKVLALHVTCQIFTTAGLLVLKDGAAVNIAAVGNPTAIGTTYDCRVGGGIIFAQGPVNSNVDLFFVGNGAFLGQITYYQAS
jgi:hypothetical protein